MGIFFNDGDWCNECNQRVRVSPGRATISETDVAITATMIKLGKEATPDVPATLDWGTKSEGLFSALIKGFFNP